MQVGEHHVGSAVVATVRSDAVFGGRSRDVSFWCAFGGREHDGCAEADQAQERQDDHSDPVGPVGVGAAAVITGMRASTQAVAAAAARRRVRMA